MQFIVSIGCQYGPRSLPRAFCSSHPLQRLPRFSILRGGEGTDGFPIQYSGVAFLSVLGIETALSDRPKVRRDVTLDPNRTQGVRHVVLVIDESVRGDLLDINSEHGVETGLLSADLPVVNFGIASSTANCSEASNVSVRMGLTRRNYLKELHSNPPIWAYAKRAGYRTAYFDGQRNGGNLQNHMNQQELQLIDEFVQLEANTPPHLRDILLARKLRTLLETSSSPQFILVNKMGAHFPYEGKYPSSDAIYKPTMAANYFGTEADPRGLGTDLDKSVDSRRRYKNSYLNAIRWNMSQFFGALLPGLNLADTVIIYTADHGQDLHEDGRPGYATHCTGGPAPAAEGSVPLAILTNHARLLPRLRKAAFENAGNASQFNVFPTLLRFMGFEPGDLKVTSGFEPSLFEALPKSNQEFLSTFYVRFGRAPVWNAISTRH